MIKNLIYLFYLHKLYFLMQGVYTVGGHIGYVYEYAEFNMFLDPLAAREVFTSFLDITLVPLQMQRRVISFSTILNRMNVTTQTPEAVFAQRLLSRLWRLQQKHYRYHHMVNLETFKRIPDDVLVHLVNMNL